MMTPWRSKARARTAASLHSWRIREAIASLRGGLHSRSTTALRQPLYPHLAPGALLFARGALPNEVRFPAYAHHGRAIFGPARLVIERFIRRCLAPCPARQRSVHLRALPCAFDGIAVGDDKDFHAGRMRRAMQPAQR